MKDYTRPIIIAMIIASMAAVANTVMEQKTLGQKLDFYSEQLKEIKDDVKEIKVYILRKKNSK